MPDERRLPFVELRDSSGVAAKKKGVVLLF